ncbi:hypothetical protein D9M70_587800 [compost metagenome]
MIDIANGLQYSPPCEGKQTRDHQPHQDITKRLAQQRLQAFVTVLGLRRVLSRQQSKDAYDQIQNAPSGISAPSEYDKGVLSGHWRISEESYKCRHVSCAGVR